MTACLAGEKLAAKNVARIFVGGEWKWRCHCGTVATAQRMGWVDGKFGLITEPHKKEKKQ